jgi:hypothetical protein
MATLKRNSPDLSQAETPSQELVRTALQPADITDALGRRITLRKPGPLAQYRLVEAAGETASNAVYMQMALPLIYVSMIDGSPVPPVQNKAQLEALIQRLDDSGIQAVMEGVLRLYGPQDPDGDKEKLKN